VGTAETAPYRSPHSAAVDYAWKFLSISSKRLHCVVCMLRSKNTLHVQFTIIFFIITRSYSSVSAAGSVPLSKPFLRPNQPPTR
jgi:hypothetical protein